MSDTPEAPRASLLNAATAILGATQLALAAAVTQQDPDRIVPAHFSISGQVDHWTHPAELAGTLAVLGMVTIGVNVLLIFRGRRADQPSVARAAEQARRAVLIIFALITGLITWMAYGGLEPGEDARLAGRITCGVIFAILISAGAVCGKIGPNPFIGVRVWWSFRSRLAWDKANRLFGRIAFLGGIAGLLLTPFAPLPVLLAMAIGIGLGGGLAATFESWRVWRSDPQRRT